MLGIILFLALLVLTTCGAIYKSWTSTAKANKSKLKKIAKTAQRKVYQCKNNEKSLMEIKDQLEDFAKRVAFNLHSVDWILTQQLDIKEKIEKTEFNLEKVRERKRKSPTVTYVSKASRETLI